MPQSRGARAQPRSSEDGPSGEALYNQGMAHYRRREWCEAREVFLRLKAVDPGRRGVDALLDELEIFIRFDSPDDALPDDAPARLSAASQAGAARSRRVGRSPAWHTLVGVAVIAGLALLIYNLLGPRAAQRAQELSALARTHVAARNWSAAIDAYEEYLLLVPGDIGARSDLWAAYYERGQQRVTEAQALEADGEFASAAERWEGAGADFRAAQQVDAGHQPDPRGETAAGIEAAEHGRRLASLVRLALDLSRQERWAEAVQALEVARSEDPAYHQAEVAGYLCDALLARGGAVLAHAETSAEVQRAVQMIAKAAGIRPEREQVQVALRRAQGYLQAVEGAEGKDWDEAVRALEPLLAEEPDYADGHAHELLCRTRWERAGAFSQGSRLTEALADYQAVADAGCALQAEARLRVSEITLALTPTATPTPTPRPTAARTATPMPSPTASVAP